MPRDSADIADLSPTQDDAELRARREVASFITHMILECGYSDPKILSDGRYACLMPLLFTTAIITGRIGDRIGYDDRWCFHDAEVARAALAQWNGEGEPDGWHRHPNTGRRRKLEGFDVLDEWIDP